MYYARKHEEPHFQQITVRDASGMIRVGQVLIRERTGSYSVCYASVVRHQKSEQFSNPIPKADADQKMRRIETF